jgi:hypothetical protein
MESYFLQSLEHAAAQTKTGPALDDASDMDVVSEAGDTVLRDIKREAIAAVQAWAETEELEEGETLTDRLYGMLSATVDRGDAESDLDDDEAELFQLAVDAAADYMADLGVSDEDVGALFDDEDDDAAERVRDLVATALPDGEEAAVDQMYGASMDSAVSFDSAGTSWARRHKGKTTIHAHHGKRAKTQHRAKWRRPSTKQKAALRKNSRRAHTAGARKRFLKSMKLSRRMGGRKVI